MAKELPHTWAGVRRDWTRLSLYHRFETFVTFALRLVTAVVIAVALFRLSLDLVLLLARSLNPLDHSVFQQVFGEIMTVLIALEFNHTLNLAVTRTRGIIHARVILMIALLAVSRKVIIVDLFAESAASILALSALMVAVGLTYWLLWEHDTRSASWARRRRRALSRPPPGTPA